MNISNKKLKKALEHYQNGDYEAALKICEKFLEKDYSNEEALFLEGDILYKLGRIDDAIVTWKINSEYNNNEEATNRLAAVDKERKAQALSYTNIQNMSSEDRVLLENAYRENIELKRQVESSPLLKDSENNSQVENEKKAETKTSENENETNTNDAIFAPIEETPSKEYAVINTNIDEIIQSKASKNQITHEFETMELEELRDKLKHLEDPATETSKDDEKEILSEEPQIVQEPVVLEEVKEEETPLTKVDEPTPKVSSTTNTNTNTNTSEPAVQKSSSSNKKVIIPIIAVAALIVVIGGAYAAISSKSSKPKEPEAKPSVTVTTPQDTTKPAESNDKPAVAPKVLDATAAAQFDSDVNYLVSANSIDGVASLLTNNPKDTIPQSSMASYDKALNFMQTTGINYYYENGMNAYNNNDYSTAISYFTKATPFAKSDFREPTMLFLTAVSYQKLDNMTQALDAYKNFLKEYPDSENYTPEALYYLANYYSEHNDATLAKQYASELQTKFASSMYNNDNIKNILK